MDASVIWEESQGIGHSYGYNRAEKLQDYKTSNELILMLMDIVARGGNLLLDIGPTADGRIPVIMQQRLTDMGTWLGRNGEAVYGTTAWKQPYQWSTGKKREQKGASFMAGYSISKLAKPDKDTAYVECLFTRKGTDLYCTLPYFRNQVRLRNFKMKPGTVAIILDTKKRLPAKQQGADFVIDLSGIKPGEAPAELVVLKLQNAL
jgi:alpha-L-fucosidase